MRSAGEMYAIVRTAKLKGSVAGNKMSATNGTPPQCIDDAAAHELRLKSIANADHARLPLNRLMVVTREGLEDLNFEQARERGLMRPELFRTMVAERLAAAGIPLTAVGTNQVLAQQVMVTASYDFFTREPALNRDPLAESRDCAVVLDHRYSSWRSDSVAFLRAKYGDRIVAIVEHLDELTPHLTAVVVPLVWKSAKLPGRGSKKKPASAAAWRLSAFDTFNRKTLGLLWTEYAAAMKRHGLRRPPQHAMITSTDVKQFYSAVADAKDTATKVDRTLSFSLPAAGSGIFAESAKAYRERAAQLFEQWKRDVAVLLRDLHFQAKAVEQLRKRETELRRALREADEQRTTDEHKRSELQQRLEAADRATSDIVASRVLEKLGLSLTPDGTQTLRTNLCDGRVVRTTKAGFSIADASSGHVTSGRGAVDLLIALFHTDAEDAMRHCVACFGEAGVGAIHAWARRRFARTEEREIVASLSAALKHSRSARVPCNAVHTLPEDLDRQLPLAAHDNRAEALPGRD